MAKEHYKAFLNEGIIGEAAVFDELTFKSINTGYIDSPKYDVRFFETFPTAWAGAYAFQRAIEAEDALAIEEWVCLFLLHYVGVLHLKRYGKETLVADYDKDLWPAFSGTYPRKDELSDIRLLKTDDELVVGTYYPEMIFFPGRGRSKWAENNILKPYLKGTHLSWEQCRDALLKDDHLRREFWAHLMSIGEHILSGELKKRLTVFRDTRRVFKDEKQSLTETREIKSDPEDWKIFGTETFTPENLLAKYPLKQQRSGGGGYTYYLVSGMPPVPDDEWMTRPIAPGMPTPDQYRLAGPKRIVVKARGQEIVCEVPDGEVLLLKTLFLTDPTYLCGIPKASKSNKVRPLHEMEVRDNLRNRGMFSALKENEIPICLAPVTCDFLKHFPEILQNPDNRVSVHAVPNGEEARWSFIISGECDQVPMDKVVTWFNKPVHSKSLPNAAVAIWPPAMADDWHLYVAHGTGAKKQETGRWILVDEKGSAATPENNIELEDDEYISILHDPDSSCKPMAMLLRDDGNNEKGILFLSKFGEDRDEAKSASLSVDFGTSNTCLAYKPKGEEPKALKFGLSPVMLWGPPPSAETPGFVPFKWAGGEFFPTILLARRKSDLTNLKPAEVQVKHLFQTDIPGLHRGMEAQLYSGVLSGLWETKKGEDMKWKLDPRKPWRSVFLGLSLLYAHAEVFFGGKERTAAKINEYVFTFPLALLDQKDTFVKAAKDVTMKIRRACYGSKLEAVEVAKTLDEEPGGVAILKRVDESTAIATEVKSSMGMAGMEILIDLGGGTADIAIRNDNKFLVLDSVKVAGNTFFRFSDKNFSESNIQGASHFKKHLGTLLLDKDEELPFHQIKIDLGTFYAVAINALDDDTFKEKEQAILAKGMGSSSFQRYRSQLFFRHIIAYALVQACAAAVEKKLTPKVKIIFGGNAWGLLMFAEFSRFKDALKKESQEILQALKKHLLELVEPDEKDYIEKLEISHVDLLNMKTLSYAKTAVAIGALKVKASAEEPKTMEPYAGITLTNVRVGKDLGPVTIRWNERWGFEHLKEKLPNLADAIPSFTFDQPADFEKPFDPLLSVFTCLGNSTRRDKDPMPAEEWAKINGLLCQGHAYLQGSKPGKSPINYFISGIFYPEEDEQSFLDELARINKL